MEIREIIELMQAASANGLTAFTLEQGDLRLSMKKEKREVYVQTAAPAGTSAGQPGVGMPVVGNLSAAAVMGLDAGAAVTAPSAGMPAGLMPGMAAGATASQGAVSQGAPAGQQIAENAADGSANPAGKAGDSGAVASDRVVTCPLVGTFYSSPAPDEEDFVKVGDTVKKGQTIGIVEAMKLMNEIECEYDGVVDAILVNNEDVVEYGQPLFRIR